MNANNKNNKTSNDSNDSNKKMSTRTIKISFQGASRDVDLSAPFTLAGLQQAIASTFEVDLPARSGPDEAGKDNGNNVSFTYKDPDGDDIVFDKDSELSLALRLCPSSLEITAARKEQPAKKRDRDPERKLYQVAARNLREYNGVPSMNPDKLAKTLVFLKLNPRRLVRQGLAPKALLVRMVAEVKKNKGPTQPLGGGEANGDNEDLAESVADGMQQMSMNVEDDKKEWDDGFVPVEAAAAPAPGLDAAADGEPSSSSSEEDDKPGADAAAPAVKKNLLHTAFIAGGIQLRPREVRPLLLALDIRPVRLVKLGYVDGKELRAMLEAEKRADRRRMARGEGPPCGPMGGKGCGPRGGGGLRGRRGAGGPGEMVPPGRHAHRLHPVFHHPPPAHVAQEEADGDMFFVPADAHRAAGGGGRHGGRPGRFGRHHPGSHPPPPPPPPAHMEEAEGDKRGGRRGGRLGRPHGHRHPHPHPHPHHRGFEEGEGGPGAFHRGPPHGMPRMHQAPCGVGQPQQHGYYYWG